MEEQNRNELDKRYLFLRRTAYLLLYATAFSWLILLAMSGKI
jgi:hypothetical protein